MKKWVLLFISDNNYYKFTMKTIQEARTIGCWTEDIVVCIPEEDMNMNWRDRSEQFDIQIKFLPKKDLSEIRQRWKNAPESYESGYLAEKPNIWNKFCIFDSFFKQWDIVFYLDSGCTIQDNLDRFKESCSPVDCLYAHSNSYPSYQWTLRDEFVYYLMPEVKQKELEDNYKLDTDYFQTTIMIFDTKLIKEDTCDTLIHLTKEYVSKHDQGIINLHYLNSWKQLPLKDNKGWLYDFHERDGCKEEDYCILKYPLKAMK